MKMQCKTTPKAVFPSPHAISEVDVSDDVYTLTCSMREAEAHCWKLLSGCRLRIILTDEAHYNKDPDYAVVTPEYEEYAWFVGVERKYLQKLP